MDSPKGPRPGKLAGHQLTFVACLQWAVITLLLCLGYWLSFSHHFGDTLDVAGRMQSGDIRGLYEFHHLIAGLLPFWLWTGLRQAGVSISALSLLQLFAFVPTVATVLLVFALLRRLEIPTLLAFGATFAFATSWGFWMYVGTGRPYSTSMFFAVSAYYVALSMNENLSEKGALFRIVGSALLVTLSCLFWLEQCFNCVGVGLLIALRSEGLTASRRFRNLAIYALTGIVLTLAILLSGFLYTGAVRTREDIQPWIATGATPPMKFDRQSVMRAAYGQAAGIVDLGGLSYMVNGLLRRDPRLLKIDSLPWQSTKFVLALLLVLPIYLYPILAWRHSSYKQKVILLSFGVPLFLNLIFALGFMGSDVERFLPSFGCLAVLAALGLRGSTMQLRWRHTLSVLLPAVLAFIAGVNLVEGALAEKRYFIGLARDLNDAVGHAGPGDFVFFFGRDFSLTYGTMFHYYLGASYLNLSDNLAFLWDRPDWQEELTAYIARARAEGGRVFVVDRLALGENPVSAAWSEVQHPKPTVQEVAYFLRTNFCLTPAWKIGSTAYWQLGPPTLSCSSPLAGSGVTQSANSPLCGVVDNGSSIYLPGLSTPNPTIPAISNYLPFVPPAKMGTYIDPAFGCTVTRLTDGEANFGFITIHNYVRSAWNADSTKFLLENQPNASFAVVDVATGGILVAFGQFDSHFSGSNADETWDRTNPNTIYYENGNTLNKADISACKLTHPCDGAHGMRVVYTKIQQFKEYTGLDVNNNKKDISLDGCYYPMGGSTSAGNFDAFWYNICTNTKGPVQTCPASAASHFISGLTHSNRMWIAWGGNGTGSCLGTWFFDNSMNAIRQLFTSTPHTTAVYDPVANKEYLLHEASGGNAQVCNSGSTSGIGKMDLQSLTDSCLISFPYQLGIVHVTSNNPGGWWGYEITDPGNTANDNSALVPKWQSLWRHLYNEIGIGNIWTGQIYRLAHSRTRTGGTSPCGGYFTQTRPSMSLDGTHIAFDSSMARTNAPLPACIQNYGDVYIIKFR